MKPPPFPIHYRLHGLTIVSDIALADLPLAEPKRAEVTIRYGTVSESLSQAELSLVTGYYGPQLSLLNLGSVIGVRYLVRDGNSIVVDGTAGGDGWSVRHFLLGPCMATLLLQRSLLPFHASAIITPGGAVLFAGNSGSGKSSVAAMLIQQGYALLADDLVAIQLDDAGRPVVAAGVPEIHLWQNSLQPLGYSTDRWLPVRPSMEKYRCPVNAYLGAPVPLRALFLLDTQPYWDVEVIPCIGGYKLPVLQHSLYRLGYMKDPRNIAPYFSHLLHIAEQIDVYQMRLPTTMPATNQVMEVISRIIER